MGFRMSVMKKLLIIIFFLMVSGAFFVFYCMQNIHEPHALQQVEIVIPKGAGLGRTIGVLETNGVIDDVWFAEIYARVMKLSGKLKAGEYRFDGQYSLADVFNKLVKGEVMLRSITIAEGKSLAEIRNILSENPNLSGDITLDLKEGDILPETYHFVKGESRNGILRKARKAMQKVLADAHESMDKDLPIKSAQELLILASIVEKETGIASERKQVASVFVNRLRIGMRLQTDPTVIYAVTDGKMDLGRPLYKKDLKFDSPYNTYLYAGLPPAPICSPGKEAIFSAAHPDKTKYLYFVADGITGGHRFAKTLKEHNNNVLLYRKQKRNR